MIIIYAAYRNVFTLKENDMYRYYIFRSYFIVCLFVSALVFSCTLIENANAREYQQIIHNEFVNFENQKDQIHITTLNTHPTTPTNHIFEQISTS